MGPDLAPDKERGVKTIVAVLLVACAAVASASAEYYVVKPQRVAPDRYRDLYSRLVIETRRCREYTHGEEAVLKFEPYSRDNKLVFDSGAVCAVVRVTR